jgi:hypothetical protein
MLAKFNRRETPFSMDPGFSHGESERKSLIHLGKVISSRRC